MLAVPLERAFVVRLDFKRPPPPPHCGLTDAEPIATRDT
jgi:hypothetical protein